MTTHTLKSYLLMFLTLRNFNCVKSKMEARIVGGKIAAPHQFPHSVYLLADCGGGVWSCSASVLNERILLTAAHCIYGCHGRYSAIKAIAGNANFKLATIVRKSKRVIVHEYYDTSLCKNDIGLMYLSADLPIGIFIKRVILLERFPDNPQAVVSGWGISDNKGTVPIVLKMAYQTVRSAKWCQAYIKLPLHPGEMCVASLNNVDTTSSGDSGSALLSRGIRGAQIGIVSYAGQNDALTIYMNVTYYINWIKKSANELYCKKL